MPKLEHEQFYWTDGEIDALTISILRKQGGMDREDLRSSLESETKLTSLTTIDLSIRRVATFSEDGAATLKPEILKKLEEA